MWKIRALFPAVAVFAMALARVGADDLKKAIMAGDLAQVERLVKAKHALVNRRDEYKYAPLHVAARYGHVKILEYLLIQKADLDAQTDRGWTALHVAAVRGESGVARLLLAKGANRELRDIYGMTPLSNAVRYGHGAIVDSLIEAGAETNVVDKNGKSLRHLAAMSRNARFHRMFPLIAEDFRKPTKDGWTALHCLIRGRFNREALALIRKGADINARTRRGKTPLHLACWSVTGAELIKPLIEKGANVTARNSEGEEPLSLAVRFAPLETIKFLVDKGAKTTAVTDYGVTTLHQAVHGERRDVLAYLVASGVPVNCANALSNTPLHDAAEHGYADSVKFLLENGAYTRIMNLKGYTPAALATNHGHWRVARLITEWEKDHPEAKKDRLPIGQAKAMTRLEALKGLQGDKYIVVIVPFGKVDMGLIQQVRELMETMLGISVFVEKQEVNIPETEDMYRMVRKKRQWNAYQLIFLLRRHIGFHGLGKVGVIGITGDDIYSQGYNFLFGSAAPGAAVMSYHRFRAGRNKKKLLKRTLNQAVSSTGLLFRIPRCKNKTCPRSYPKSLGEHDRKGNKLCAQCRKGFTDRFGVAGRPLKDLNWQNHEPGAADGRLRIANRLLGHTEAVTGLTFTGEGKRLVSASRDGSLRVWNVDTGKLERVYSGHKGAVRAVAAASKGTLVASGDEDGDVRIWDAATGKGGLLLRGHKRAILALAMSADGKYVASAGLDQRLRVVDLSNKKHVASRTSGRSCRSLAFSPDGKLLAAGGTNGEVHLWKLPGCQLQTTFRAHQYGIRAIEFSDAGDRVYTASDDLSIRSWAVASGKLVRARLGHTSLVSGLGRRTGSAELISCDMEGNVATWAAAGEKPNTLARVCKTALRTLALQADGSFAAVGGSDNAVYLIKAPFKRQE